MLDLQFLETLVDEALSNETESTLREWLSSQREADLFSYFGDGLVEDIASSYNFEIKTAINTFVNRKSDVLSHYNKEFAIAA